MNGLNKANSMEEQKIKTEENMLGFEVALEDLAKTTRPKQLDLSNLKLDVGCGVVGSGDVNCDLYIRDVGHRFDGSVIDTKTISNFVCCDALNLPFKDCLFTVVNCSHVIEHVKNPFALMNELLRVCCIGGKIIIRCPHLLGDRYPHVIFGRNAAFHFNKFNRKWFAEHYNVVESRVYAWRSLFGNWIRLFYVPAQIEIAIKKQ